MDKLIHFVYLVGDKTPEFGLIYYIVIKSYLKNCPNSVVYFHTNSIPNYSSWWHRLTKEYKDRIRAIGLRSDWVEETKELGIEDLTHKADYLRLRILEFYGGMYTDLDNMCLCDVEFLFDWCSKEHKPVYCTEVDMNNYFGSISNGFMIHPPFHDWTRKMIDLYKNYNPDEKSKEDWVETSINKPTKLYLEDKSQVIELPAGITNPTTWEPKDRISLFMHNDIDYAEECWFLHFNEGLSKRFFWWIDLTHIMTVDTNFTRAVRPYVIDLWNFEKNCPKVNWYR